MTITRVNEFRARPGKAESLRDYLGSILPEIESSEGCLYCQLMQGHDDPERFLVIETWESIPAHQLAIQDIDKETFLQTMNALAQDVTAAYFHAG